MQLRDERDGDLMSKKLTRDMVEQKYKWKLEDIYPSRADWESDFKSASESAEEIKKLSESMTQSSEKLAQGLEKLDEVSYKLEKLYTYAKMHRDLDNADPEAQALTDRAGTLLVKVSSAASFINPLLLSMDEEKLTQWKEKPELENYKFYIEDLLRSKQHILPAEQEKLLSMAGDFSGGARDIFTMLNNADLKFDSVEHNGETHTLSHSNYILYMQNPDRELRKKVYQTFYEGFKSHINTIAATYATSVKKDVFYADVRGYESALAKPLFGDNVPLKVYDDLIDTVHKHLPTMYEYLSLRKKLLGVEKLAMYDVYVPLSNAGEDSYSYEEAKDMVLAATAPLGEDYTETLKEAFDNRWIDVCATENKTTGAYSWGVYGVHPYVLLNHRGDLDSVFTLAHELGHAMHSYYSNKTQPYPLASYVIFVAEVASTVNEILLTKYLLKIVTDKELRKHILCHYLDQFRTTVFRQTMFAEFEKKAHEMAAAGEPLTPETFGSVYQELNDLYYGEGVEKDDVVRYEWARIPHFYNAFYVYKYATGFSCASAIVAGLDDPENLRKYREFLCSGGTDYPIALLEKAGVNFDTAVETCMQEFAKALEEFRELTEEK